MVIHVAYFDPANGRIIQCVSGDRASLEASSLPFVELTARPPLGFDQTHRVVDGAVVPIA